MDKVYEIILDLYRARREAKGAREAFKQVCEANGPCQIADSAPFTEESSMSCFLSEHLARHEWCKPCAERQPFWEAKHDKSLRAGVALRRVLTIGRKLSQGENDHGN